MRILVTGATGVLGRPVVRRLVAAGHTVRGLSRSPANAALLRQLGAEPVATDLFDVASLQASLQDCDAVLHLATKIPPTSRAGRLSAWAENDRIRREGTRALVTAALASQTVRTFIYPSFALVYPESGDAWIDAANTIAAPTAIQRTTLDAEAEVARFASAGGRRGLSLRMGAFYGLDVPSAQDQLHIARMGFSPLPGRPEGYLPLIWVDDAASAIVAALDRGDSGVYDIVDDTPLRRAEIAAAMAAVVGRKRLRPLPAWLMRLAGGPGVDSLSRSQRVSNRRFKAATGWAPSVPDAYAGLPRLVGPAVAPAHETPSSVPLLRA
ncbi:MAG TPA: NAD-dependent epimerase/dehydratase family protein [Ktedonobacterales bacterium]|nr:NAD-dependent epimerase/dehydratase family protein [Ktedonobacterales bacterium]